MDPFIYIYSLGGIIFIIGLLYGVKQGAIGLSGTPLRNLLICLGIMLFFAVMQGFQQYAPMKTAAPGVYDGSADHLLGKGRTRGAPVDYGMVIGYFVLIVAIGTWYGRKQKTTNDFFFGGRRFSWWLISFSLVATTIGSYSFVKYASKGFAFGLSSSQSYLNDWIWVPLLLFGWLPILYFSRFTSIPEYFGRRFGSNVRLMATICILIYMVGYVGVNLFTMGKVLNSLLGWPIPLAALLVAVVSASYVTTGGQTSVIMTDLFQGLMLLVAGTLILVLGIQYLGGFEEFWQNLPRGHRLAFPNFNENQSFPSVGIFWQDAIANSAMFGFLHQGTMMRYMAARSLPDARRAAISQVWLLATIAACVVGGGGWVARALVHAGKLPDTVQADNAFYVATELLARPGVFGLVLASLTAALMSTVDTLITAISAVSVNDVYKLYLKPDASEKQQLRAARLFALTATILGVVLVPIFMQFESIYSAHGAFTAAVTPPLVVTLMLSVFWRRFTAKAAMATMVGGLGAVIVSLIFPQVITPIAHGVPMKEVEDGFLVGMQQYKYMRAAFGLGTSTLIGVVVTLFTQPTSIEQQRGLVWGTARGIGGFLMGRGGALAKVQKGEASDCEQELAPVAVSSALAESLSLEPGNPIYLSDTRCWLGGLYSAHAQVSSIFEEEQEQVVRLTPDTFDRVVSNGRAKQRIRVEKTR